MSKDKTALEIVTQKLKELVKKEPATPSGSINPQLVVYMIIEVKANRGITSVN